MTTAALRSRIAEAELAIFRQYQVLDDLENHLKRLQEQLNSVVYPILTLPPEITSEIFVHCLTFNPSGWDWDDGMIMKTEAPLLLTQVCRKWREIALATPSLWNIVPSFCVSGLHASMILETWAIRARASPLSVRLGEAMYAYPEAASMSLDDFAGVFRHHSNKFQRLHLELYTMDLSKLMDVDTQDFPRLQELIIALPYDEQLEGTATSWSINSPLLRKIKLERIPVSSIQLPWEQLSEFFGYRYSLRECLEALRFLPNITHCEFLLEDYEREEIPDQPFLHSKIQDFRINELLIYSDDEWNLPHILKFLTLPALQSLEIGRSQYLETETLDDFVRRSCPPLRRLELSATMTHCRSIQPFDKLGITDLEIHFPRSDFASRFFGALASDPSFLPQLRNLSFHCGEHGTGHQSGVNLAYFVREFPPAILARERILSEGCPTPLSR